MSGLFIRAFFNLKYKRMRKTELKSKVLTDGVKLAMYNGKTVVSLEFYKVKNNN